MMKKVFEKKCSKEELYKLQKSFFCGNVLQRDEGLVFLIVGDRCPDDFSASNSEISLEEVYLYYIEYENDKNDLP